MLPVMSFKRWLVGFAMAGMLSGGMLAVGEVKAQSEPSDGDCYCFTSGFYFRGVDCYSNDSCGPGTGMYCDVICD